MALSLLAVFAVARLLVLWGRPLPLSAWTPFACMWQDVLVVLGFALLERFIRRDWPVRVVYAMLVLLAAITVPVARVLSSPLTAPMLKATRGALSDSFYYHATPGNIVGAMVVLALAIALPFVLHPPARHRRALVGAALTIVVVGFVGAARVDTRGLERNPLLALIRTSVPRVHAQASNADWRASPLTLQKASITVSGGADLSSLRGVAAGQSVLLVVLESTAARYLQPYGAAEDPMPNLTRLAARSIVFENAYAAYPESIKGLVATLASRYPAFDAAVDRHTAIMQPSLASALEYVGYETALFHSGRFRYLGMDRIVGASGFGLTEDAGDIGGNHDSSFGIDEVAAVDHILAWIDGVPRDRPFFAAYLPIAGHHPYAHSAPGPFPETNELGRYRNALYEGDAALGRLLDGLRTRGIADSTVIIVIGDHGEAFGQHEGNYGHNLALYDENVRVPFIVSLPQGRAQRLERTASLIDVAPTVLELVGITPPPAFQGESLLADRERMALFFTDYSLSLLGLRDGCMKYLHELESRRSRLFDICDDPDERTELSSRFPERVALYREHVRRWSAAQVAAIGRARAKG